MSRVRGWRAARRDCRAAERQSPDRRIRRRAESICPTTRYLTSAVKLERGGGGRGARHSDKAEKDERNLAQASIRRKNRMAMKILHGEVHTYKILGMQVSHDH